jgi:hypothetical protein
MKRFLISTRIGLINENAVDEKNVDVAANCIVKTKNFLDEKRDIYGHGYVEI